ncbi:Hermansky-Pudlak syndrome 5 protein isoform X2 [Hypomesus transpacificus]|uniref:Hermansky-Pudlak syndrome 5 protein isoform X2 n=1 Tax=Hypomesus transpacificus TaxID=137520 RepID=UPI001F07A9F8|nr:Hermansky-Pudlak syndrome 5 protein isoform X2 [Hypomesus transpacificus]
MVPVVSESHSHVLAEFDCLDPLLSALRLDSGRLKCTCLAVSRKWLAIGTSSGGLHLIQRDGWKQRLILTHKEGSITQVACCPHDEDFIAVATSQGLLVVWELQLERRGRPERVSVSWEHRAQAVTSLCWDTTALRVFVGDAGGKVSFLRAGSSKLGKGSAFVIFPVQTITTVDSRVVQLGYADGRLLVSSLSRCYLCDTEREKFWRVGNKERDGEYGACFFPQSRGLAGGQPPLLYCARPGSRIWEASFSGEVLSTHQFKQMLACPPVPLISYRTEPQYSHVQRTPQSVAFPKLLCLGDQHLLTWTDSAIYIFTPQTGQVLLWSEVKDVVEVAVYRSELFCLYGDGHLSHLSLLSAERCVERLLRREAWVAAASVCCMFQHTIAPSRVRKSIPVDRLDHLRSQLSSSTHSDLIGQLEEVISKLEPLDSASSSRRSSISSHESFNVLDCGIYRVISRRGSQSDEETSSLVSQSMLEEERLKEFSFGQEEDQVDHDHQSSERVEGERSEPSLQFHLPLSFRPKPPRIALQAVRDSVSSFVKKTTEKINTLQMNSDIWPRPDHREGGVQAELVPSSAPLPEEPEHEASVSQPNTENDLQELCTATERAAFLIQDPLVLLDPACLGEALEEWLPVLERVLGPPVEGHLGVEGWERDHPDCEDQSPSLEEPPADQGEEKEGPEDSPASGEEGNQRSDHLRPEGGGEEAVPVTSNGAPSEPIVVRPPKPLPPDLQVQLGPLATLFVETRCFRGMLKHPGDGGHTGVTTFMRRYFFLLDLERVRRMCVLSFHDQPELQSSFMEAMLELTQSNKVVEVIHKGDLLKSLRSLRELQPWSTPHLLAHLHRLYEKHGEVAVRSFTQFYPAVLPSDIMTMAQPSHFLAYLDNLVQSRAEEQRLAFLGSLLQPESLRQDWLQLALSHNAPQHSDTLTSDGHPRWHSHFFSWGYGRFLSLLIRLPADLDSKQNMAETCRTNGYWTGYLYLCCELQRRSEAFSAICRLDDISLLEEPNGVVPQTLDEWKTVIQMSHQCSRSLQQAQACAGRSLANGSLDSSNQLSPESLTLRLARAVGPDRALAALQECGVEVELRPHSALVCELLRVAEKRQRALIQTMLERCDRFLWSQPA